MSDELTRIFDAYDRGRMTRRQLLYALGLGAGFAAFPRHATVLGQGQCGGARAGAPECDTTPAKPPFESTGWKTVRLEHFSVQVADYEKEAAYYAALMNWKIRSDDGKQAILDIGDWGSIIIRGGYEAPASAPPPPAGRAPRLAQFDSFCWGIEPWDAKKVEAELKKRGLNPVPGDDKEFPSFHIKDPGGFDLQIADGRKSSHAESANGKLAGAAPFEPTDWKTVWLDHISFQVPNYKESVAFYTALLGWTPTKDEGSQNQMEIGDVGDIIVRRGGGAGRRGADPAAPTAQPSAPPPPRPATIDHIAFGISPWDPDKVKAELDKRNLPARVDTGGRGDIHTASYQSYHTTTPNGYDLQISFATKATRTASAG